MTVYVSAYGALPPNRDWVECKVAKRARLVHFQQVGVTWPGSPDIAE